MVSKLKKAYASVLPKIGDPLLSETLIGPLHTPAAVDVYKKTVAEAVKLGGTIEFGGKVRLIEILFTVIFVASCVNTGDIF